MEGSPPVVKAVYDFIRVAVACGVFVLLEPAVSSWLKILPTPFPGIVGVVLASALTWGFFELVNPTTQVRFSWRELADGPEETGPTLKIEAGHAQPGQTFSITAERDTVTFLGRAILRGLVRSGIRVSIEPSQRELHMVLQRTNEFVTGDGSSVAVRPSMPKHPVNSVPFEMDLSWDEIAQPEFTAKLKYEVATDHFVSTWLARTLVWVHPSIREVRKVTRG